jgi:ubiquinone/menaquinone biosynthesis C-methylase UbiE
MSYYSTHKHLPFVKVGDSLIADDLSISIESIHSFLVPIFCRQSKGVNEFSITDAATIHDNAMNWLHQVHGTSEDCFRTKLVSEIPLVDNDTPRILVTSCGAGNDLKYLLKRYPSGVFYVQDIAYEMLNAAISRNEAVLNKSQFNFSVSDACDLPFDDEIFDIVYHFGGVNLFPNIKKGIEEMHRVAKPGGAILFGDEGIAPYLYNDEIANILIKNNSLYACKSPHSFIPSFVDNFKLQYLFNNCFYLVTYTKKVDHSINLDIHHLGKRGGSLRTRYFGQLEGVDPVLRNRLYEKAEQMGMSRVELIEKILLCGLSND